VRPLTGGAELRGNLFARRNRTEQFNVNVGDPDVRAFIDGRSAGGALELAMPTRIGALPLAVTVGAEYARNAVRYRIFNEPNAAADTLDDSCDEPTGLCEQASVDEDDAALFAQTVLGLGEQLSVTGSLRADWVRVPFRDLREPDHNGTSTFRRLSPRLGLNYQRGQVRGYVAASGGFRAPAALELACADETAPCPLPFSLGDDPPLRPVSVWNYETGLDWERRNAMLDVVLFRTDVRNEIVFAAAEATAGYFQNVPRTRRQGLEVSAALPLTRTTRLRADYAFLEATYRSTVRLATALGEDASPAEPGDRFPLSPLHRGTVAFAATRLAAALVLDGEISLSAVSSQFLRGDEANEYSPVPGYAVAHLRFEAEHERFAITAHVTNLLDRRFETFGIWAENPKGPIGGPPPADPETLERFLNPGYPRAITVAIKAKF
jgi:outer membrane receptor protein involved in Fe transport